MARGKGRLQVDQNFAEKVDDDIGAAWVRRTFKDAYGVGWQRRLANNLGVGESTLSGWLKDDDFPQTVKLALVALELRYQDRAKPRWHPLKVGDRFSVASLGEPTGDVVAENISDEGNARLIAAAPMLHEALVRASVLVRDTSEVMGDLWADDAAFIHQALELVDGTEDGDEQRVIKDAH